MGFFDFLGGGAPDYADIARKQEEARQARINQGTLAITNVFGQFNPQFYQKRAQAYVDYAMPQLSEQYQQTKGQIGFGLANRGLTKSSAAENQWSDLAIQMSKAKQNISDSATGQSQDLQKQIENSRDQALSMLYQSADPAGATAAATSSAASFATPSTFVPLANQFNNLIQQYYNNQLLNNFRMSTPVVVGGISPVTSNPVGPSEVTVKQ